MTALLFDLDGTLIDSRVTIADACNHALLATGRAALPVETIASFVGDGAAALLSRAAGTDDAVELAKMIEVWRAFYVAHPISGTTWMHSAREAIRSLPGPKAIVTNKSRPVTMAIVDALGIEQDFQAIVAGGDTALKPDAAPVLRALELLGVPVNDAWMIGDAVQDVRAAKAAGCRSVAVLGGFQEEARLRAEAPDVIIASLAELGEAIGLTAPSARPA